jgi:GrpB-like predicted nucleotidyltransferase (UPF0157 family)
VAAPVVIVDYDPRWPGIFDILRARLAAALGALAQRIEHVGSTAVPGLAAKPVIDIDVVIASQADLPAVVAALRPLGYEHEGDLGVPGREAFTSPPGLPAHHLYACAADTPALARHLRLRDILRERPEVAAAYAALKRDLAVRFRHDRPGYTEAKTAFIEQVLAAAQQPAARSPAAPSSAAQPPAAPPPAVRPPRGGPPCGGVPG